MKKLLFMAAILTVALFAGVGDPAYAASFDAGSMGLMSALLVGGITAPFPVTPELTAIAIGYKNKKMIADEVLPRVPVGKKEFKYMKLDKGEMLTIPDTKVGRRSKPNEVEFSAAEVTDSTINYGLDDPIPQEDINNAPPNFDPLGNGVEGIQGLIALAREARTANLVFAGANYAASNKIALAGVDQFSDPGSDPIGVIMDAKDVCILTPNIGVIGRQVFSQLARHPQIVKAVHGNSGDSGIASRRAIAELFELDDLFVGEAWVNSAKKGRTVSLARAWGKHFCLFYRDQTATTRGGTTFGITAQFGSRVAGSKPDGDIGLFGGQRVRSGESVKELITANDLGYLIQNAVA